MLPRPGIRCPHNLSGSSARSPPFASVPPDVPVARPGRCCRASEAGTYALTSGEVAVSLNASSRRTIRVPQRPSGLSTAAPVVVRGGSSTSTTTIRHRPRSVRSSNDSTCPQALRSRRSRSVRTSTPDSPTAIPFRQFRPCISRGPTVASPNASRRTAGALWLNDSADHTKLLTRIGSAKSTHRNLLRTTSSVGCHAGPVRDTLEDCHMPPGSGVDREACVRRQRFSSTAQSKACANATTVALSMKTSMSRSCAWLRAIAAPSGNLRTFQYAPSSAAESVNVPDLKGGSSALVT